MLSLQSPYITWPNKPVLISRAPMLQPVLKFWRFRLNPRPDYATQSGVWGYWPIGVKVGDGCRTCVWFRI